VADSAGAVRSWHQGAVPGRAALAGAGGGVRPSCRAWAVARAWWGGAVFPTAVVGNPQSRLARRRWRGVGVVAVRRIVRYRVGQFGSSRSACEGLPPVASAWNCRNLFRTIRRTSRGPSASAWTSRRGASVPANYFWGPPRRPVGERVSCLREPAS